MWDSLTPQLLNALNFNFDNPICNIFVAKFQLTIDVTFAVVDGMDVHGWLSIKPLSDTQVLVSYCCKVDDELRTRNESLQVKSWNRFVSDVEAVAKAYHKEIVRVLDSE